jgi:3-oxoacyl-[acyl-carrier-protein] synthase II
MTSIETERVRAGANDAAAVAITGLGLVSPLGCSLDGLARSFAAGPPVVESAGDGWSVPEIPLQAIPDERRARIGRLDRLCRLFLSASYGAVEHARFAASGYDADRVGLSFGTGLGCLLTNEEYYRKVVEQGPPAASPRLFAYTVSSAAAGEVSIALDIRGPNVTEHVGTAAGLGALGYGFDLIQMGKADAVLAGGADAIGPALVRALRDMGLLKSFAGARPFRDHVPGVWPSEGAVVAVLEPRDRALARGVQPFGTVRGYAIGFEPTLTRASPRSTGVVGAMRRALLLSGLDAEDVGVVVTSAHGTLLDRVELEATREVFGTSNFTLLLAPKARLGETFAASGMLGLALTIALARVDSVDGEDVGFGIDGRPLPASVANERLRAGTVVMVNALCYSGSIVSLVFSREEG